MAAAASMASLALLRRVRLPRIARTALNPMARFFRISRRTNAQRRLPSLTDQALPFLGMDANSRYMTAPPMKGDQRHAHLSRSVNPNQTLPPPGARGQPPVRKLSPRANADDRKTRPVRPEDVSR